MTEGEALALKRLAEISTRLLADAGFLELLKTLKNDAIRKWSEGKDTATREAAWHDLQAVGRLENRLKDYPREWALQAKKVEGMKKRER